MHGLRAPAVSRIVFLVLPLIAAALWAWSYHTPLGVGRIAFDVWLTASDHGSIVIARRSDSVFTRSGRLKARYGVFAGPCLLADQSSIARAQLGHTFLGFGFAVERPPGPGDTVWVLDDNGIARPVDLADSIISPPRAQSWAVALPWWSGFTLVSAIYFCLWRRTRPRYAAFPITPLASQSSSPAEVSKPS